MFNALNVNMLIVVIHFTYIPSEYFGNGCSTIRCYYFVYQILDVVIIKNSWLLNTALSYEHEII